MSLVILLSATKFSKYLIKMGPHGQSDILWVNLCIKNVHYKDPMQIKLIIDQIPSNICMHFSLIKIITIAKESEELSYAALAPKG